MIYCDKCAKENNWPNGEWRFKSIGICEICGNLSDCYDIPSKSLPIPEN